MSAIEKNELGFKAVHREVTELEGIYALRERDEAYRRSFGGESDTLSPSQILE